MKNLILSMGDPTTACEAAAVWARELGFDATIISTKLEGEAKDLGILLAGMADEIVRRNRPFKAPCALISGGETTVTVGKECGRGGPNQETVLGFVSAFRVEGARVAFASVDTDGTDGPTEIAGGIADGMSRRRAIGQGIQLNQTLKTHSASDALESLGDVLVTGHTGTNVMNLRVLLVGGDGT
jgi:glycerate-2-kinase